ncbi:AraC family transcriptional regulator [Vibrio vulnificus]|uniref:AraC family transcriptional regulator n=1 Tax=Vibrio vulnificus TaxID=672 RepID=UPI001CDD6289|nr:AraC family transcriptional regulator [Vibrio vulnificus]EJR3609916.1 AraC family transcriptional regulator [Vibrio vulnificus]EJV9307734.1 AraC family transcriptional regulator [Vibrio vulnificus]ELK2253770.1 AraC family transcriptional regulator [Vibrio vulnificus]ELV8605228.1 AraC family transcriptional regulator [Vibrio vulnificus]ELV8661411.1 AraC family transcriptional regulator [Vibrio vulnificus]
MATAQSRDRSVSTFNRISKVLSFIHNNLDAPLSLEDIAEQSCWSRWQLQRVFQAETGLTVAHYVRELKLSTAAEMLLDTDQRVIDIALSLSFNSEIAFSRAFKQLFGYSPRLYRKQAQRFGLKKPIEISEINHAGINSSSFVEVKVDTKEAFLLKGVRGEMNGLFSLKPNFAQVVPLLWKNLEEAATNLPPLMNRRLGVVDVTQASFDGSHIKYWAGIELDSNISLPELPSLISDQLETLAVPQQTYAIVKHKGPIERLPKTLEWFIIHWLPNSGYRGIDGYELEVYPTDYHPNSLNAEMEYWVPIQKV